MNQNIPQYELSQEQEFVINKCISGENLFVTSSAGCGKSLLIKILKNIYLPTNLERNDSVKNLKNILKKYNNVEFKKLQVCAMTGVASILLECNAKTIHSWSGIGISNGTKEEILKKVKKSSYYRKNWCDIEILIVDEVSMMSQHMFEVLDYIAQHIRKNSRPFGGIQIIMFGDCFQLPPVCKDPNDKLKKNFCFESPLWFDTFPIENNIELIKIFRQTDERFKEILNQIREGKIKRNVNEFLINYVGRERNLDVIQPTKLFPKRSQVDYINSFEMNKLQCDIYEYEIQYVNDLPMNERQMQLRKQFTEEEIKNELNYLQSNLPCEKLIELKLGAQVMCVVNINVSDEKPICNGSQGVIIGFTNENENEDEDVKCLPIIRFSKGFTYIMGYYTWESENIPGIGVKQIPLTLAWALTIHKSQGATMDAIEVDAGTGIFECGQTYVALSRVRTLEGLYLSAFDVNRIKVNGKVIKFYEKIRRERMRKEEEQKKEQEQNDINNKLIEQEQKEIEEQNLLNNNLIREEYFNSEEKTNNDEKFNENYEYKQQNNNIFENYEYKEEKREEQKEDSKSKKNIKSVKINIR